MAGVFFWFFFGQAKKNKARRRRYAPQPKHNLSKQMVSMFKVQGSMFNVQGSTFNVQNSLLKTYDLKNCLLSWHHIRELMLFTTMHTCST